MEWIPIWLLCAVFSAVGASVKNRSTMGWFCLGLLVGPFGLLVFLMPKVGAEAPVSLSLDLPDRWACAGCGHRNYERDVYCRKCGTNRPAPVEDAPPELAPPAEVECPWCKELIKPGALKCKHCGSMLGEDQPARAAGGSTAP